MRASADAAKALLDRIESEKTSLNEEEKKLQFDLSIAFLFMASDCVCGNRRLDGGFQTELMDGVCNRYIEDLEKYREQDPIHNSVDADFFIRDAGERASFRRYANLDTDKLPKTDLYTLASCLLQERWLEYRELHKQDIQDTLTKRPGFVPRMPQRVYEHFSGEKSRTPERLMFTVELYTRLAAFGLTLTKQLSEISVKTTEK